MNLDLQSCLRIAKYVSYSGIGVDAQDREDFIQDAQLEMIERASRNGGGLSIKEMWRAARCVRNRYWRAYKKRKRIVSLNVVIDEKGTELRDTIADKSAVDLDARLDAQAQLEAYPPKALGLAAKRASGGTLTNAEHCRLWRYRKKEIPSRPAPDTGIGRFAGVISRLVAEGCGSYRIWRALQRLGYEGSRSAVKYYLAGERARRWRRESKRRLKLKQKEKYKPQTKSAAYTETH